MRDKHNFISLKATNCTINKYAVINISNTFTLTINISKHHVVFRVSLKLYAH